MSAAVAGVRASFEACGPRPITSTRQNAGFPAALAPVDLELAVEHAALHLHDRRARLHRHADLRQRLDHLTRLARSHRQLGEARVRLVDQALLLGQLHLGLTQLGRLFAARMLSRIC